MARDTAIGDVVEFNRGGGPEYGIVVELGEDGAEIAPLKESAEGPFKKTEADSVEGRGGEYRSL